MNVLVSRSRTLDSRDQHSKTTSKYHKTASKEVDPEAD